MRLTVSGVRFRPALFWEILRVGAPGSLNTVLTNLNIALLTGPVAPFGTFATDRGIAPSTAATALGLLSGCTIIGSLLAGTVSDRIGRKNPLALIYFLRAAAFVCLLTAHSSWMLYLFAAVAGISWFSTVPLTVALTAEIYGVRHMGTLVGIAFTSHQVDGAVSIYLAGRLFDLSGSYTVVYVVRLPSY